MTGTGKSREPEPAWSISACRSSRTVPNDARADVHRQAADRGGEGARDGVDEVLDREQLVEVAAVAEDRDPAAVANPVEQDLEDAEPLRADERLRPDDHDVEPAAAELAGQLLGLDLRLAVPPHADERIVLDDRVPLGDAVDGGRRDQDDAPHAGGERAGEHVRRALDVDGADRCAGRLDRQRRRGVHEHVRAVDERAHVALGADVAANLLERPARARGRRAAPRRASAPCRRRRARGARDGARGSRPHRRSRPASRVQGSPVGAVRDAVPASPTACRRRDPPGAGAR